MTLKFKALKKSKVKYLVVLLVILSMVFPSTVFAGTGDTTAGSAPTLTPSITTQTTGKIAVTVTFPSDVTTFLSKQISVDNGISWREYTGPISITDNTTVKSMYTYSSGNETYSSQVGVLTINNITASTSSDVNNGSWTEKNIQKNYTSEADAMVRVGDIDNFGFGFQQGYDPFSGNSTPKHAYPWLVGANEPAGLDRIMEVSGYYKTTSHSGADGYTTASGTTAAQEITMGYDLTGINVTSAKIQMFVDDFQAGIRADNAASSYYRAQDVIYTVTINGSPVPEFASDINQLNQSGPIGKLITFNLPAEYLQLVKTGQLKIKIDDTNVAKYGDGYAIDFIKLLVNPKDVNNTASISGKVTDVETGEKLVGAKVTANGLSVITDNDGNYTLPKLNAGLAVVQASNSKYSPSSLTKELIKNNVYTGVDLKLKKSPKPGKPVIKEDVLVPTNQDVHMTITYPDDPAEKYYSDHQDNGKDVWVAYTGSFVEHSNCIVKARSISAATVESDIAEYAITNINKDVPAAPTVTADRTENYVEAVVVTTVFPAGSVNKKISYNIGNGNTWVDIAESVFTVTQTLNDNATVNAKYDNIYGTTSRIGTCDVQNIDHKPAVPTFRQDIITPTTGTVNVTVIPNANRNATEWSYDGNTWTPYTTPIPVTSNRTILARSISLLGTRSDIAPWSVTNIIGGTGTVDR